MKAHLHTDGGARGNPGPSAYGVVLVTPHKEIHLGVYIGQATNNQAEYKGLLSGLKLALNEGIKELDVYLDSELIVKQLSGEYRVKDKDLKLIWEKVGELMIKFDRVIVKHVPRDKNKQADYMVNQALDEALGD